MPEWSWHAAYDATGDGLPYLGLHRNFPRHFFALGQGPARRRRLPGSPRGSRTVGAGRARKGGRAVRFRPYPVTASSAVDQLVAPSTWSGVTVSCSRRHASALGASHPETPHGQPTGAGDRPHPPPRRIRRDAGGSRQLRAVSRSAAPTLAAGPAAVLRADRRRRRRADRQARIRRHHGARRVPAGGEHRRRAPALAVPHGAHRAPAAGEDGALLAQPLRDRLQQGRRASSSATDGDAGAGGEADRGSRRRARDSSSCSASTRSATSATCSSPSRRIRRCSCGSTGARTCSAQPQENFARELMELFTMGVGTFAETDVYAGARVFTGWNLARPGTAPRSTTRSATTPASTRPRRRNSRSRSTRTAARRFPRAPAPSGMQDGIDLIDAVARHPATGPRLARKLYSFFVNEVDAPGHGADRSRWRRTYYSQRLRDRAVMRVLLLVAAVPRSRRTTTSATAGRWSSSSGRSRKSGGRASRSTTR